MVEFIEFIIGFPFLVMSEWQIGAFLGVGSFTMLDVFITFSLAGLFISVIMHGANWRAKN